MKSSKPNTQLKSCCVIIQQRACCKHEPGCSEPALAVGWIIFEHKYDDYSKKLLLDALEQLGFTEGLAQKV